MATALADAPTQQQRERGGARAVRTQRKAQGRALPMRTATHCTQAARRCATTSSQSPVLCSAGISPAEGRKDCRSAVSARPSGHFVDCQRPSASCLGWRCVCFALRSALRCSALLFALLCATLRSALCSAVRCCVLLCALLCASTAGCGGVWRAQRCARARRSQHDKRHGMARRGA